MSRKTDGEKVDELVVLTADLAARLVSLDDRFKALAELLQRATDTAGVHLEKITSVEKQVVVLVDLKGSVSAIASIREDLIGIKKDVESLKSWKDEKK